ncbi:hypothetical protein [Streptomyces sp. NPDC058678]|uniref:hypothetical protein n=1 Tax=Streptomyces sp. NPDC058678 TaxID=3346595 RepID=UPI00365CF11B
MGSQEETARSYRAGPLYRLTHLAAGLTEVVGVQDVIDLVADQITGACDRAAHRRRGTPGAAVRNGQLTAEMTRR